ncbi:MAG: hypothetical protein ACP5UO_01855 [Thermoplasmata archaeon]
MAIDDAASNTLSPVTRESTMPAKAIPTPARAAISYTSAVRRRVSLKSLRNEYASLYPCFPYFDLRNLDDANST